MASTLTIQPDWGYGAEVSPRVDRIAFGDGYSQQVSRGINPTDTKLTLSWTNRTKADVDAVQAVLTSSLSSYFLWTPPNESTARKWRAMTPWKLTPTFSNIHTLTAEVEEVR